MIKSLGLNRLKAHFKLKSGVLRSMKEGLKK